MLARSSVIVDFYPKTAEDIEHFQKHEPRVMRKINALLQNIAETPFAGLGKPEALKHQYSGYWSRRISDEHRLVYRVEGGVIFILQCRFHYS